MKESDCLKMDVTLSFQERIQLKIKMKRNKKTIVNSKSLQYKLNTSE